LKLSTQISEEMRGKT